VCQPVVGHQTSLPGDEMTMVFSLRGKNLLPAGVSPTWVGNLMKGRIRPTNPKLMSYLDEGEPDTEDLLPEEGVAISLILTNLSPTIVMVMVNVIF
jgi:hypothetical protein